VPDIGHQPLIGVLPARPVSAENLKIMRLIDEQYLKTPFAGSRSMRNFLRRLGYKINRKRVQRLMRLMGLEAIYPKPRTSRPHPAHKIYPYLLRNVTIERPNQVWAADITYVPMSRGHMYLVAIMDWQSRKVLSWRVSNTMDTDFCIDALNEALSRYGAPEIFNTDQGAQFTSVRIAVVISMSLTLNPVYGYFQPALHKVVNCLSPSNILGSDD
jgi:putative transposase